MRQQSDCPAADAGTRFRCAEVAQNSGQISAKSSQTPQSRASNSACLSALLWVGHAQSMRATSFPTKQPDRVSLWRYRIAAKADGFAQPCSPPSIRQAGAVRLVSQCAEEKLRSQPDINPPDRQSLGRRHAMNIDVKMPIDLAGVRIPDSKLTCEITELVRDTETPLLFHHSSRVY